MVRKSQNTAQFSIRIPQQMKDKLQASAEKQNIDGVDWIRQAIQEKLDRENNPAPELTDEELDERIRGVVMEMLAEMRKRGRGNVASSTQSENSKS